MRSLMLSTENKPNIRKPTAAAIAAAVARMTPRGGPSFLILEDNSESYVQAAGGDGVFTVEWRDVAAANFTHWKAGLPGSASVEEVAIPMNGHQIEVQGHERLGPADVVAILEAFRTGQPRPMAYAWRNITATFV